MQTNRLYNQFMVLFGGLMTVFYFGIGYYFIFSPNLSYIDNFLRYLFGGTLVFYGIYRLIRTYVKVKEEFFSDKYEDE
jgi:hypothetical protein